MVVKAFPVCRTGVGDFRTSPAHWPLIERKIEVFKIICECGSGDIFIYDKIIHCRKCGMEQHLYYLIGEEGSMID